MTRTAKLDTEAASAHVLLDDLKQQHATLSLKVSEHPADTELHAQLDALDTALAATEKTLARLASARHEAKHLDDRDQRHAKVAIVQEAFRAGMTFATKDLPAAAEEVCNAAGAFARAVGQYDVARQKIVAQVKIVADHAGASLSPDRRAALIQEALVPYAAGPFARIIASMGVDLLCGEHVTFRDLQDQTPLLDAVDVAAKRLLVRLKPEAEKILKDLSK